MRTKLVVAVTTVALHALVIGVDVAQAAPKSRWSIK
jgi:hypothetical protein